jgi:hypothetical protein
MVIGVPGPLRGPRRSEPSSHLALGFLAVFDPEPAYTVVPENLQISEFTEYWEDYVVRPPYQRKTVWSRSKQQALLDSLFRGYYVPRIVIREVRLSDRQVRREVVDGQQRISTAKAFRDDVIALPSSLEDLDASLPGKRFSELSSEVRRFVNRMSFTADVIKGISDPLDSHHQEIASEIFWRLQQGVPLNFMETAHARLASLARNFIVRHADDISFDFENYEPLETNPDKHPFFSIINRKNDRMQHLSLLARFLISKRPAARPTSRTRTSVSSSRKHSSRTASEVRATRTTRPQRAPCGRCGRFTRFSRKTLSSAKGSR